MSSPTVTQHTALSPAQLMWLRSTLRGVIDRQEEPTRISAVCRHTRQEAMTLSREETSLLFRAERAGEQNAFHVEPERAIDLLLNALTPPFDALLVEQKGDTVIYRIEGAKVIREVEQSPALQTASWAVGKSTHLDPNQAAPLLKTIGLMTLEGKIKAPMRKKFKQVNHFLDLMAPLVKQSDTKRPYLIVDCGCGKSYLGFTLFWYLRRTLNRPGRFVGVDTSMKLVEQCRNRAAELDLSDTRFECARIQDAKLPNNADLLVSLHACDTATDEALARGVELRARRIAAAPCCQHELVNQITGAPYYPIARHTLFKHRFADLLTDMTRALFLESKGYRVTVGEFVSVEETPKNLMIRATLEENASRTSQRLLEYEAFKRQYGIQPSVDFSAER